jgi:hypothetical protein
VQLGSIGIENRRAQSAPDLDHSHRASRREDEVSGQFDRSENRNRGGAHDDYPCLVFPTARHPAAKTIAPATRAILSMECPLADERSGLLSEASLAPVRFVPMSPCLGFGIVCIAWSPRSGAVARSSPAELADSLSRKVAKRGGRCGAGEHKPSRQTTAVTGWLAGSPWMCGHRTDPTDTL